MYKAADSEIETSLRLGGPDGLATSEKDDLPLADFAGCMTKLLDGDRTRSGLDADGCRPIPANFAG